MRAKKIIFIIPGFRQRTTSKAYIEISKILKNEGYSPILVEIPWRNSTISQNTEYFLKVYKKTHARKKYILGFSYGAMIAFIAAARVNTSGLILCSLSPYFNEDISRTKNEALRVKKPRLLSENASFRHFNSRTKSPRFSEGRNEAITYLMEERYRDFSKLHCATLAKKVKAKQVLMLYGKEEAHSLIKRVTEAFHEIESEKKTLIPIKKTEHNIADKKYLLTISEAVRTLL